MNHHEPKRILQVVTYMGRGGIETMLMNYYRHMDRSRLQFDFLVHRSFRADFDDEIEALGGRIHRLPPMGSRHYWKALGDFFRTHPYQVVHCHLNYKSGLVLAAAKRAGVPVRVAHAHTAGMDPGFSGLVRRLLRPLIPRTATHDLACSAAAGNALFGDRPYGLIPNALDAAALRFNPQIRDRTRKALNLGGAYTLIHVGRFSREKNHAFVLDAFAQVRKREPGAVLLLVGDGPLRPELERRAAAFQAGAVRFLGIRADIPDLLQAGDIFVFPSVFEGLGIALIEAQAAGLPCIKSDSVPAESMVTDLVRSLPTVDPQVWADAILAAKGTPRTDRLAQLRAGGYDIHDAAKILSRFYRTGEMP